MTGPDLSWFIQARFGLFIHWGIYSVAARHEWVQSREKIASWDYRQYFDHFDPDLYNPRIWAQEAKAAGMRYAVITGKHHDGFCLWDSDQTTYKASNTPARRDLLLPFVNAFREEGFRVGFYYSLIDWHHPHFPLDGFHPLREDPQAREKAASRQMGVYRQYLHAQARELLTRFGKLDLMWYDFSYPGMDWGWAQGKGRQDWGSVDLLKMTRELQPGIIVNDRLDIPGDFVTPEQYQPRDGMVVNGEPVVWEACQTLNGSWGVDRDNLDWKSPDMLVRMLVDTVSKGGNLLLNVGPNARGEFEPRAIERLRAIGGWMRLHGRAIYGCSASDFTPPPDCRYTQNGRRLYLHLLAYPFGHVHLPGLAGKVAYAQFLHDASEVRRLEIDPDQTAQNTTMAGAPDALILSLPVQRPEVIVPVVELFLK